MIKNEQCNICGSTDWHNLDYLRDQEYWYQKEKRHEDEPVGFKICTNCGFITYDYIEEERLALLYQAERPVMTASNIITCNRKKSYHKKFLKDINIFDEFINNKNRKFLDIGCSQGAFLKFLHDEYGIRKSNLYGTEVNKAFINFARYEYGLKNVSDTLPDKIKFDLISYYHVLEHFQHPEIELEKALNMLAEDGLMYISVPYWMEVTQLFDGALVNDFENLYHLNHVNVFTKQSFKNLLNKFGLEIIHEDSIYYAYTVLAGRGEIKPIVKENWEDYKKRLELEKQAISLVSTTPDESIKILPTYPDAYIMYSLNKDNMRAFDLQIKILEDGLKTCPDDSKLVMQLARVYFQWDEQKPDKKPFISNNILKSEKLFYKCLNLKPDNEESYYFLGIIEGKYKKNYEKACEFLDKIFEHNPSRWAEIWNLKSFFRNEQGK